MRLGRSYKQHGIDGRFDVIVVGSGIGGLACAALLAKHGGKRVLVVERHYTAGGFTHVFHRKDYEWDVGVHYIGQTNPRALLRRAFDEISDGALQWADMGEIYDSIIIGQDRYDFPAGRRRWREQMVGYFPDEAAAIDEYLALVARSVRSSQQFFADKALPPALSAIAGPVLRHQTLKLGRRTTLDVLRSLTNNRRLIAVLTGQYGDYGLPPAKSSFFMHSLVVNHYFGGGAYPVGGSTQIAATIIPLIERAGGAVVTNANVKEIVVESGRAVGVRLEDGAVHRADAIVSDAGALNTFGRLVPNEAAERHGFDDRLRKVEPSVAHASLYLGFQKTAEELGLGKTNLWVYPDVDHDASVARFVADKNAPLPVAYVSFPSAKDPTFSERYPGRATVEVVTLAPYKWFEPWRDTRWKKRGDDYEALKKALTDKMLAALYGQCPQLEGQVDHCELSTPLSTRHFCNFAEGEIYGLAHTPERFDQKWLRPRTPIQGLFLTGADVCSAGVGGALFGGLLTASTMLKKNLIGVVAKRRPSA